MKMYGWVEVELQAFMTSVLDGGEWSALRSTRFAPPGTSPLVPIG